MSKKLLFILSLCTISIVAKANDVAIDFMLINNYDVRQNQDIWARMRAGFKLSHPQTARVKYYERLYTKNPQVFNRIMTNARPYLYFILTEIERSGLPSELALIPGVESSFNPLAKNPTDAYAGMWQFVPATGKRFGMVQNSEIDERRDIVKSTRAALSYLIYLHALFGQWEPAIGAYNWGEGNIYRAILNSGQLLGQVDYNDLRLRSITADYVPKVIALASIIDNPSKFGVNLADEQNQPYFAIISPATTTSISDLIKSSDIDNATFTKLNPEFKDKNYQLTTQDSILLPLKNQAIYYASLDQTNNLTQLKLASIESSQSLPSIKDNKQAEATAQSLPLIHPTASSGVVLASSNTFKLNKAAESSLDDLIDNLTMAQAMPAKVTPKKFNHQVTANHNHTISYTVNPGDTLYSIAKKFKASIWQIKMQNKILGNNLMAGQVLLIKTGTANNNPLMANG